MTHPHRAPDLGRGGAATASAVGSPEVDLRAGGAGMQRSPRGPSRAVSIASGEAGAQLSRASDAVSRLARQRAAACRLVPWPLPIHGRKTPGASGRSHAFLNVTGRLRTCRSARPRRRGRGPGAGSGFGRGPLPREPSRFSAFASSCPRAGRRREGGGQTRHGLGMRPRDSAAHRRPRSRYAIRHSS